MRGFKMQISTQTDDQKLEKKIFALMKAAKLRNMTLKTQNPGFNIL